MAQVIWQESAIAHLQSIYHYYYEHTSEAVAARILIDLQNAPDVLESFPYSGSEETSFSHLSTTYYYLVVRKRYKIIYMVEDNICSILAIWDVRKNPDMLASMIFE